MCGHWRGGNTPVTSPTQPTHDRQYMASIACKHKELLETNHPTGAHMSTTTSPRIGDIYTNRHDNDLWIVIDIRAHKWFTGENSEIVLMCMGTGEERSVFAYVFDGWYRKVTN